MQSGKLDAKVLFNGYGFQLKWRKRKEKEEKKTSAMSVQSKCLPSKWKGLDKVIVLVR